MRNLLISFLLLSAAGLVSAQERTPSPKGAEVYIISPADGAVLKGPVTVRFGLKGMGIAPDQLEEAYRQRTTLKVNVYTEDVAEAILFFASDRSSKITGGILNVDGGLVAAYVR